MALVSLEQIYLKGELEITVMSAEFIQAKCFKRRQIQG